MGAPQQGYVTGSGRYMGAAEEGQLVILPEETVSEYHSSLRGLNLMLCTKPGHDSRVELRLAGRLVRATRRPRTHGFKDQIVVEFRLFELTDEGQELASLLSHLHWAV